MERLNSDLQCFFGSEIATGTAKITSSTLYSLDLTSLLTMLPSTESVGKGGVLQVFRLLDRDSLTGDLELLTEVLLAAGPNCDGSKVSLLPNQCFHFQSLPAIETLRLTPTSRHRTVSRAPACP